MTFLEVRNMKPCHFKTLVKKRVHDKAFRDLIDRKNGGQKGKKTFIKKN